MKMRAVQIQFGRNVLRANGGMDLMAFKNMLMYLPNDCKIGGFLEGLSTDTVSILIEHDEFSEVEESHLIPVVTARFTNEYGYIQFDKFDSTECKQIKDGLFVFEKYNKSIDDIIKNAYAPVINTMLEERIPDIATQKLDNYYSSYKDTYEDAARDVLLYGKAYVKNLDVVRVKDLQDIPICFSTKITRPGKYYYAFTEYKLLVNNDSERLRGIKGFNEYKHYIEVSSKGRLVGSSLTDLCFIPLTDNTVRVGYDSSYHYPSITNQLKPMQETINKIASSGIKNTCDHSWKQYTGIMESYSYCEKCDEKI